jgi:hypothetical protein
MTVMFLIASLVIAIAFETGLVGLPLHLIGLLNPSPWIAWGGLLLLLGWCLGE